MKYQLPQELHAAFNLQLEEWRQNKKVARLWAGDATLWTCSDESKWMGWLSIVAQQLSHRESLEAFAREIKGTQFSHILLLGMGGSSLCPDVLSRTFGTIPGYPRLTILDSTDPVQIKALSFDPAKTLFIVSSKSGSTLEPNIFMQYFYECVEKAGVQNPGQHFIAITDPGSKFEQTAKDRNFRNIFYGVPSIGGRYSALSNFGIIPAAAMGVDVRRFLTHAQQMVKACSAEVTPAENPGVQLGLILGCAALLGRDKLTLIASPGIQDLGAWLEQLIAESTGKQDKGIIPVDLEPLGTPRDYGTDRVFAYLRLDSASDAAQDKAVDALEKAGHPMVRLHLQDHYSLAQEFFRWEIATAVAGSVIGINPFNQPDVEASKIATRKLTDEFEQNGQLPPEKCLISEDGMQLFTDPANAEALGPQTSVRDYLAAHLQRLHPSDYLALLAYIPMNARHQEILQAIRTAVRDSKQVATCVGFGPRFLHSTGQAYKGGPNSGVFLQITCDDAADLAVPGQKYTFGVVKAAQARGDFDVLSQRQRRAMRIHLGKDIEAGLIELTQMIKEIASCN